MSDLNTALRLQSDAVEMLALRARLLLEAGDVAAATRDVDTALGLPGGDEIPELHLLRGRILANNNDLDGAVTALRNALQLNSSLGDASYYLAVVAKAQGNEQERMKRLDHATGFADGLLRAEAHYERGDYHYSKEDYRAAQADFEKALKHNPDHVLAHEYRGRVREALGDFDGALADYEAYLRLGGAKLYKDEKEIQRRIKEARKSSKKR
ncbi:MAG: tetratricopeptide repeat protein [Anaerolineae bacterium]|nr:tetratricopeptide repeat protein [Anaerolineae bacterium]